MSYKPGEKIKGTNVIYHGAGIYQFVPVELTPEQQAENDRYMEEIRKRIDEAAAKLGMTLERDEQHGTNTKNAKD